MAVTIDDDKGLMSSTDFPEVAERQPDGTWRVTGRPGAYDRNQAITAMSIAEIRAMNPAPGDPLWQAVQAWETELKDAPEVPDGR